MRVKIYWNLHKDCFSVQHKGKVIEYTHYIVLVDAEFKVGQAGRARVLKERRKNVHAFVVGEYCGNLLDSRYCEPIRVSYNPYKNDSFVDSQGNKITKAKQVVLQSFFDENYNRKPQIFAFEKLT